MRVPARASSLLIAVLLCLSAGAQALAQDDDWTWQDGSDIKQWW